MTSIATELRQCTLAIVSDNAFARDLASNAVRQIGAPRIILVRGLADVRDQFAATPPNIVLCDADDPDTDALTLTRQLRSKALPAPAATPIILISTQSRAVDVAAARDAGVTEYMVAPFTVQSLSARLESALLRPRPFVEAATYVGPCRRRRNTAGYGGPFRRQIDGDGAIHTRDSPERAALLAQIVAIRRLNRTVNLTAMTRVWAVHKAAHEMLQLALRLKDPPVIVACTALYGYIERRGPRRGFDPRLIEKHMDGLHALFTITDGPDRIMLADDMAAILDKAQATPTTWLITS
ncbi:MAG: response regulator [Alphaproteobacteria bacterium]|nr:response regulator [Alphaproteobacteria bacterium]